MSISEFDVDRVIRLAVREGQSYLDLPYDEQAGGPFVLQKVTRIDLSPLLTGSEMRFEYKGKEVIVTKVPKPHELDFKRSPVKRPFWQRIRG